MDQEPNYESYSFAELRDARAHVDAERYPERAARLDVLLRDYQEEVSVPSANTTRNVVIPPIVFKMIGGWEIIAPCSVIIFSVLSEMSLPFYKASSGSWEIVLISVFWLLSALSVVAGILLILEHRLGYSLSKLVQGIQVLSFRFGSFTYLIFIGAWIMIDVRGSGGRVGSGITTKALSTDVWFLSEGHWYIGVNIIAGTLYLLLIKRQIQVNEGTIKNES